MGLNLKIIIEGEEDRFWVGLFILFEIWNVIVGKRRVCDMEIKVSSVVGGEMLRVNGYVFVDDEELELELVRRLKLLKVLVINFGLGDVIFNLFKI